MALNPPTPGMDLSTGTGFQWLSNLYQTITNSINGSKGAGISITASSGVAFTASVKGTVWIHGGTVSAISIGRSGTQWVTGMTIGGFSVSMGDTITITFSSVPTVFLLPS